MRLIMMKGKQPSKGETKRGARDATDDNFTQKHPSRLTNRRRMFQQDISNYEYHR